MTSPDSLFRVLVVDDDPDLNNVLVDMLEFHDFKCTGVDSGEAALDYLSRTAPPHLILLDIMLPGIDGYGVLKRIRSDTRLKAVSVWMISTASDDRSRRIAAERGANGFIAKPFEPMDVVIQVKNMSSHAQ